jgi:hypothetical protein
LPKTLLVVACLLSVLMAVLAVACGDDENGGDTTPTSTLAPTDVPTIPADTPTPAPDIRAEDLTQQAGLQEYLTASGGVVTQEAIVYSDVTDDGSEDAIVPVSSGGEGGNIALFVYGFGPSGLAELLRKTTDTSLTASIVDGQLEVTEASYGPGDPFCCPSDLITTTYRWDGSALVPETPPATPAPSATEEQ